MKFEFDSSKVLYAVGVLFGVGALIYFARDLVFDLSLTVKAALLLVLFVALFVAASAVRRAGLDAVLYVLSAATYVAFVGYVVSRFDVGDTGIFLALAASSVLFVGLGYLHRERGLRVEAGTATRVAVALFVVAAVFVAADLLVGGVAYSFTAAESADAGDHEVRVGTVAAENEFVFRESTDFPETTACVYAPDRRDRSVDYRRSAENWRVPDSVGAGETVTAEAWIWLETEERAAVDNGTIPVERAESCPESTDEPRIVVVVEDE